MTLYHLRWKLKILNPIRKICFHFFFKTRGFLFLQSMMVIEFDKNINRLAMHWIVDKIRMRKSDGGAQLLIRKEPATR